MACDRFVDAIKGSALGSALPVDAAAHLAICESCRTILDDEERVMATINSALAAVASTPPAPDFMIRVRQHVERSPRWIPSVLLVPPAVAAFVLLLAALAVIRLPGGGKGLHQTSVAAPVETQRAASDEPTAKPDLGASPVSPKRHVPVYRPKVTERDRVPQAPEVLIPVRQREAVDRLFASVRAGRPEVISMLARAQGEESRTGAPAVVIEPLRIDPVVVAPLASLPSIDNK